MLQQTKRSQQGKKRETSAEFYSQIETILTHGLPSRWACCQTPTQTHFTPVNKPSPPAWLPVSAGLPVLCWHQQRDLQTRQKKKLC